MKTKYKVIVSIFILVSAVLFFSVTFASEFFIEFEYVMLETYSGLLLLLFALIVLIFAMLEQNKSEKKELFKKLFSSLSIVITIFSLSFIFSAYISCFDSYTPEELYINEKEYVQAFFPYKNLNEIKTFEDLIYKGSLDYSNFPGSTSISVTSSNDSYDYKMNYMRSSNVPLVINNQLRHINLTHMYDNHQSVEIHGDKVDVYSKADKVFATVNKFYEYINVTIEPSQNITVSPEEVAEIVHEQLSVSHKAVTEDNRFRERPWYDVIYYIKEWNEPYQTSEYFK